MKTKIYSLLLFCLYFLPSYAQIENSTLHPFFDSITNKFGYMTTSKIVVINPIFDEAYSFQDSIAKVKQENKYGLINKSGNFVIEPFYLKLSLIYKDYMIAEFFDYRLINIERDNICDLHYIDLDWESIQTKIYNSNIDNDSLLVRILGMLEGNEREKALFEFACIDDKFGLLILKEIIDNINNYMTIDKIYKELDKRKFLKE